MPKKICMQKKSEDPKSDTKGKNLLSVGIPGPCRDEKTSTEVDSSSAAAVNEESSNNSERQRKVVSDESSIFPEISQGGKSSVVGSSRLVKDGSSSSSSREVRNNDNKRNQKTSHATLTDDDFPIIHGDTNRARQEEPSKACLLDTESAGSSTKNERVCERISFSAKASHSEIKLRQDTLSEVHLSLDTTLARDATIKEDEVCGQEASRYENRIQQQKSYYEADLSPNSAVEAVSEIKDIEREAMKDETDSTSDVDLNLLTRSHPPDKVEGNGTKLRLECTSGTSSQESISTDFQFQLPSGKRKTRASFKHPSEVSDSGPKRKRAKTSSVVDLLKASEKVDKRKSTRLRVKSEQTTKAKKSEKAISSPGTSFRSKEDVERAIRGRIISHRETSAARRPSTEKEEYETQSKSVSDVSPRKRKPSENTSISSGKLLEAIPPKRVQKGPETLTSSTDESKSSPRGKKTSSKSPGSCKKSKNKSNAETTKDGQSKAGVKTRMKVTSKTELIKEFEGDAAFIAAGETPPSQGVGSADSVSSETSSNRKRSKYKEIIYTGEKCSIISQTEGMREKIEYPDNWENYLTMEPVMGISSTEIETERLSTDPLKECTESNSPAKQELPYREQGPKTIDKNPQMSPEKEYGNEHAGDTLTISFPGSSTAEAEQSPAESPREEADQSAADSSRDEADQSAADSSRDEADQSAADSSREEADQSAAGSSRDEADQSAAGSSRDEADQSAADSSRDEADQSAADSSRDEADQSAADSSRDEADQSAADSSRDEADQSAADSSRDEANQSPAESSREDDQSPAELSRQGVKKTDNYYRQSCSKICTGARPKTHGKSTQILPQRDYRGRPSLDRAIAESQSNNSELFPSFEEFKETLGVHRVQVVDISFDAFDRALGIDRSSDHSVPEYRQRFKIISPKHFAEAACYDDRMMKSIDNEIDSNDPQSSKMMEQDCLPTIEEFRKTLRADEIPPLSEEVAFEIINKALEEMESKQRHIQSKKVVRFLIPKEEALSTSASRTSPESHTDEATFQDAVSSTQCINRDPIPGILAFSGCCKRGSPIGLAVPDCFDFRAIANVLDEVLRSEFSNTTEGVHDDSRWSEASEDGEESNEDINRLIAESGMKVKRSQIISSSSDDEFTSARTFEPVEVGLQFPTREVTDEKLRSLSDKSTSSDANSKECSKNSSERGEDSSESYVESSESDHTIREFPKISLERSSSEINLCESSDNSDNVSPRKRPRKDYVEKTI